MVEEQRQIMRFILASSSTRRKALLKKIIPHFRVFKPTISENTSNLKNLTPERYVQILAYAKTGNIARRVKEGIIIGADTVVCARGKIIGKPGTARRACLILKKLSGTKHRVITGVCVLDAKTGRLASGYEETILRIKKLNPTEIAYLASRKTHWDKAGGYALQEKRDPYVKIIRGRLDNAVGLPLALVKRLIISVIN